MYYPTQVGLKWQPLTVVFGFGGEARSNFIYCTVRFGEETVLEPEDDWNQKKVSLLEGKEVVDEVLLEQVAKVLKVTPEAIKTFDEEAVFHFINNFNDNSINHGPLNNYHCTFNAIDKIVELYEALVKSEKEKVELLQRMLDKRN